MPAAAKKARITCVPDTPAAYAKVTDYPVALLYADRLARLHHYVSY